MWSTVRRDAWCIFNKRIRIRDQQRVPTAAHLKILMRDKSLVREETFALSADVSGAHRQVPADPRDSHRLGCQVQSGGTIHGVGTFGVASASYDWCRVHIHARGSRGVTHPPTILQRGARAAQDEDPGFSDPDGSSSESHFSERLSPQTSHPNHDLCPTISSLIIATMHLRVNSITMSREVQHFKPQRCTFCVTDVRHQENPSNSPPGRETLSESRDVKLGIAPRFCSRYCAGN